MPAAVGTHGVRFGGRGCGVWNVVRAGPIWYGVVVFRHVAGVASVCFGNGPRTTDHGSVDPGVACRIFLRFDWH